MACEDSRSVPWPGIRERASMRSLLREGLRFPDPTVQSRSEGNGMQGTGRHAGSAAEATCPHTASFRRAPSWDKGGLH